MASLSCTQQYGRPERDENHSERGKLFVHCLVLYVPFLVVHYRSGNSSRKFPWPQQAMHIIRLSLDVCCDSPRFCWFRVSFLESKAWPSFFEFQVFSLRSRYTLDIAFTLVRTLYFLWLCNQMGFFAPSLAVIPSEDNAHSLTYFIRERLLLPSPRESFGTELVLATGLSYMPVV